MRRGVFYADSRIETAELRMDRDPGTGRKMINQYLVISAVVDRR